MSTQLQGGTPLWAGWVATAEPVPPAMGSASGVSRMTSDARRAGARPVTDRMTTADRASVPSHAGGTGWFHGPVSDELRSLSQVMRDADTLLAAGRRASAWAWPTGFPLLDTYLGGGIRAGELCLL